MDPRYPLSGVEVEEEKVSLGRQEVIKDPVLVDLQLQFCWITNCSLNPTEEDEEL